jgi:flagellar basal body-associated protein FliL
MKKKIIIVLVVVLLGGGYVAKGMLMPPPKTHDKITGTIYVLPKEFLVNLVDGRYGKVTVALDLAPGQSNGATAGGEAGPTPPEVRDIVTNILTDQTGSTLTTQHGRDRVKTRILLAIRKKTDVKVSDVLFTDVAVQ